MPFIKQAGKFAEANPKLTSTVVSLSAGLIGLRLAGLLASFSLRWMWGGVLATAAGSLRLVAGAIGLVTSATKLLRLALIGTGIGALLVGLGTAGMFIFNNWGQLPKFFDSFGESLKRNLRPGAAASGQWLIDKAREAYRWFDNLTGKLDDSTWRRWGAAAGEATASVVTYLADLASKAQPVVDQIMELWKKADCPVLVQRSAAQSGTASNPKFAISFRLSGMAHPGATRSAKPFQE